MPVSELRPKYRGSRQLDPKLCGQHHAQLTTTPPTRRSHSSRVAVAVAIAVAVAGAVAVAVWRLRVARDRLALIALALLARLLLLMLLGRLLALLLLLLLLLPSQHGWQVNSLCVPGEGERGRGGKGEQLQHGARETCGEGLSVHRSPSCPFAPSPASPPCPPGGAAAPASLPSPPPP
eukprot:1720901-Prymnesium_polylepis.1